MRTTLYHGGISGAKIFIKHVNISLTEFLFVKMVFAIFPYTHIYISCCRFYIHHQSLILSNLKRGKNWKCEHISFQTISTTIYADLTNFSVKSWWLCRWFGVIWEIRGNQVSKLFFFKCSLTKRFFSFLVLCKILCFYTEILFIYFSYYYWN